MTCLEMSGKNKKELWRNVFCFLPHFAGLLISGRASLYWRQSVKRCTRITEAPNKETVGAKPRKLWNFLLPLGTGQSITTSITTWSLGSPSKCQESQRDLVCEAWKSDFLALQKSWFSSRHCKMSWTCCTWLLMSGEKCQEEEVLHW